MDVTVPCPCPGTPHPDGDTVTLRDKVTLPMGLGTANILMASDGEDELDVATLTGRVGQIWILEGIESWTLVDERGDPWPPERANIKEFLHDFAATLPLLDAASGLYSDAIINPLVGRTSASSLDGQTEDSTSPSSASPRKRRSRSTPSSPDTTEDTTPSDE